MSDMSVRNSADEEINDHYSYRKNVQMQNSQKSKITMKAKPKKQKLIMVNTSDQNLNDEEIDVCTPLLLYHKHFFNFPYITHQYVIIEKMGKCLILKDLKPL
ncbi:hypothetical protein QTP88_000515 [Uroleucon formosanum]